jgi:cobyrinic acid a,c-diamide synthase
MLYLAEQLCIYSGQSYHMCAVLSGQAVMAKTLQGIGMQQLKWNNKTIRGHSFHHARFDTSLPVKAYSQHRNKARQGEAFYQDGGICASFLHLWFASSATITRKLFGIQ